MTAAIMGPSLVALASRSIIDAMTRVW